MPRRSHLLPVPPREVIGILSSSAARQEQATRLLAHAQHLLAQIEARQQTLERCLAVLRTAKPRAYFLHTLDPPTLTSCPYHRRGAHNVPILSPLFVAALQQTRDRHETVRLNALLILVRLGFPVALWHFVVPSALLMEPAALAPQAAQAV